MTKGERSIVALANHAVREANLSHIDYDEAFQVAYLAGLQATRSAEKNRQKPKRCYLIQWMMQSLIRFNKQHNYESVREGGQSKLPIEKEKDTSKVVAGAEDVSTGVHESVDAKDFLACHLSTLDHKQRQAIDLVYFQGLSMTDAAIVLGLAGRDSVHKRIKSAFKKIRENDQNSRGRK